MIPPEQMSPKEWREDETRSLSVRSGSILTLAVTDITDDLVPEEKLVKYSGVELRALAYVLNVARSGTKQTKAASIVTALRMRERLASETVESLCDRYSRRALRSMARTVKAFLGGNKKQLAYSLIGWREKCRFQGKARIAEAKQFRAGRVAVAEGRPIHVWLARAMLTPRDGGRHLTEAQIEGWTRQGDLLVSPND